MLAPVAAARLVSQICNDSKISLSAYTMYRLMETLGCERMIRLVSCDWKSHMTVASKQCMGGITGKWHHGVEDLFQAWLAFSGVLVG